MEKAKFHYETALENLKLNFGDNYIENAEIYKNIALLLFHLKKYFLASFNFEKAIEVYTQYNGEGYPDLVDLYI